jgi:tetratricopeptide (TPR) repeat protein
MAVTKATNVDEYIAEQNDHLKKNPNCANTQYNLGMAYLSKRMFQEAEKAFRACVAESPRFAEAYIQLGGIALQRGDLEGCLSFNAQAKDSRPQFAVPYANMAFCWLQKPDVKEDDAERAIQLLKKAITRDPNYVQAFGLLGGAYLMLGLLNESIEASKQAIELEPKFGPAYNNIAISLMRMDKHAEAIPYADKAAEMGYDVAPEIMDELAAHRQ